MQHEILQVKVAEAAKMLNYSLRYVNDLIYSGRLRIVGTGKARRVPVDELKRWQRDNMSNAT